MSVNINTSVTDEFYRYKMPKLTVKPEGKGNGKKTVVSNMVEVAKALNCPPAYPTKFFGCELGTQTIIDDQLSKYIVSGAHSAPTLREILDKFISKYILCPQCELPELIAKVKNGNYKASCGACGWSGLLDNSHKVVTYIIKHPPSSSELSVKQKKTTGTIKGAVGKKDKKDRRAEKNAKAAAKSNKTSKLVDCDEEKNGDQKKKKEKGDKDEDDWGEVDVSEEAVKARRLEMEKGFSKAVQDMICSEVDYMEMPESERIKLFVDFIKDESKSPREIYDEAIRLDVTDLALHKLVEYKWADQVLKRIGPCEVLFRFFTNDNEEMMIHVLGAVEELVTQHHPGLLPETYKIIHLLYEHDIVDESVILQWAAQKSSKFTLNKLMWEKVKKSSSKFIDWLENAESETEEDENGDQIAAGSNDGIAFSSNADEIEIPEQEGRGVSSKYVIPTLNDTKKAGTSTTGDEENEDDFNIDDI